MGGDIASGPGHKVIRDLLILRRHSAILIMLYDTSADVAQLVEHQLPKLRVAGSRPVIRSIWLV
jgi:hypothetical protein